MNRLYSMPGGAPRQAEPFPDPADSGNTFPSREAARVAQRELVRVQIEALVSGDFPPLCLGPELVQRLNLAWNRSGQQIHLLHVEVLRAPLQCPRCGCHALHRAYRRGFFQLKVYPLLGMYPWSCISCRRVSLLRLRAVEDPRRLAAHQAEHVRAA
jgi:hypothetical protein